MKKYFYVDSEGKTQRYIYCVRFCPEPYKQEQLNEDIFQISQTMFMCKRCKQILGLNKKIDLEPEIVASAADIVKEETAIETEKQVNNVKKLVKAKKDRLRNYKYKFCAYVVRCKDKTLYFGITTIDLKKAIKNHNNGCGSVYTKIRRPVVLLKSLNATSMIKANFRKSELKREYKQ